MSDTKTKPVYMRQRFLLNFLQQLINGATLTDIQKLVFLSSRKADVKYYDFIPYKYGPYSFQLSEDIDILCRDHFIVNNNPNIVATNRQQTISFIQLPSERGNKLIQKVYEEYPYYAINSEILKRFFSDQEISKIMEIKTSFFSPEVKLFTIGYEGKNLESFINILIKNNIELLCDVRKNPISRKFGFSKAKIQHILETIGIRYVHMPEVGIDSEKRISLKTLNDYEVLFSDYKSNIQNISKHLDSIAQLLFENRRIALMCYEQNPQICHRHIIRDYIVKKYDVKCEDL